MYKNYFILNRIVLELNSLLNRSTIVEVFSQEKDKLILKCVNEKQLFLEISVNPGEPYLTLKNEYHRAKKNSVDVFEDFLPLDIKNFEISDHDRLVRINCAEINIYFAIRGKHTNIYVDDRNGLITSFKNEDESYLNEFKEEITSHNFISGKNKIEFVSPDLEFDEYRKKYPFIGKEIIAEAKYRYSDKSKKNHSEYITKITDEILTAEPAVFITEHSNDLSLAVNSFHIFPYDDLKKFKSVTDALNYFIGKKFYLDAYSSKRKITEKHIERELSKLASKLNDLTERIERGSKEDEYKKIGNLLLINLLIISHKSTFVEIEDIYDNSKIIKVKLDPKLTPQQNADFYFKKAGNEKIAFKKSNELFKNISINYNKLLNIKKEFEKTEDLEGLSKIMKELKIKSEEKKNPADDLKLKFKHYIIENMYDVFVGKDSSNNDLLTMKFAKQNDYWFHARSVPGSHVVLKVKSSKEPVPKNVLKKAASITAFHSKAKTSGLAPVSFTLKKYVTKKKGMEPGKVALLKEDVLLVKPEIPQGCEYISND